MIYKIISTTLKLRRTSKKIILMNIVLISGYLFSSYESSDRGLRYVTNNPYNPYIRNPKNRNYEMNPPHQFKPQFEYGENEFRAAGSSSGAYYDTSYAGSMPGTYYDTNYAGSSPGSYGE